MYATYTCQRQINKCVQYQDIYNRLATPTSHAMPQHRHTPTVQLPQWEDMFLEFDKQIAAEEESGSAAKASLAPAQNDSSSVNELRQRKQVWLELLRDRGMPHSMVASFFRDVTGDDDFEAKLRGHIPQDEADGLLAQACVVCTCNKQGWFDYHYTSRYLYPNSLNKSIRLWQAQG